MSSRSQKNHLKIKNVAVGGIVTHGDILGHPEAKVVIMVVKSEGENWKDMPEFGDASYIAKAQKKKQKYNQAFSSLQDQKQQTRHELSSSSFLMRLRIRLRKITPRSKYCRGWQGPQLTS